MRAAWIPWRVRLAAVLTGRPWVGGWAATRKRDLPVRDGSRDAGAAEVRHPLVLFDGGCGLCSRSVAWLLAKDRERRLRFAPLRGETAARLRALHPGIPEDLSTVVLVEGGRVHLRSRALLGAARHLALPWRWLAGLRVLPAALLDPPYRLVARIRHRLGGRARVRTPEDPRVLP